MTDDTTITTHGRKGMPAVRDNGLVSGVYGMAFIGAAVYFIQHADSFWTVVLGILQAIFWPAVLIYKLLEFLK